MLQSVLGVTGARQIVGSWDIVGTTLFRRLLASLAGLGVLGGHFLFRIVIIVFDKSDSLSKVSTVYFFDEEAYNFVNTVFVVIKSACLLKRT